MTSEMEERKMNKNIRYTQFTKKSGPLTKVISLGVGNTLAKDTKQCAMAQGYAETKSAASLKSLGKQLDELNANQAIALGTCSLIKDGAVADVVIKDIKKNISDNNVIARTKEFFEWSNLVLLDCDKGAEYPPEKLIKTIDSFFPGFKDVEKLIRPSSSAGICNSSGEPLDGCSANYHIFFCIENPADAQRLGTVLGQRLWLSGMGFIKISKSGSQLICQAIDKAVFDPSRLVFSATPVLKDGLQRHVENQFIPGGIQFVDSTKCPDLDAGEQKRYNQLVADAKAKTAHKATEVYEDYLEQRAVQLTEADKSISIERARQIIRSSYESEVLDYELLLEFERFGAVRLMDVYRDLKKYDKCLLRDPLEPDYDGGRYVAQFYANMGSYAAPSIHSYAHGERTYALLKTPIKYLNNRFVFVVIGGTDRVYELTSDDCRMMRTHTFKTAYQKLSLPVIHKAKVKDKKSGKERIVTNVEWEKAPIWWLNDDARNLYFGITVDPSESCSSDTLNLFRGYAVTPNKSLDCDLFLDHLFNVIAQGDESIYEWLLDWMAWPFLNPAKPKTEVCLFLRGEPGTGKGTVAKWLLEIYGKHGQIIQKGAHIGSNFNAHFMNKLFAFVDEAFFAGDRKTADNLKTMISEKEILVEPKGVDSFLTENRMNFMFSTNHDHAAFVEPGDRRYCVLDVPSTHKQDYDYFARIDEQLENGGASGLLALLMERNPTVASIRNYPKTDALLQQKIMSSNSVYQFVASLLENEGIPVGSIPVLMETDAHEEGNRCWPDEILKEDFYWLYQRYAEKMKIKHPYSNSVFFRQLGKLLKLEETQRAIGGQGKRKRIIALPRLDDLEKLFMEAMGL